MESHLRTIILSILIFLNPTQGIGCVSPLFRDLTKQYIGQEVLTLLKIALKVFKLDPRLYIGLGIWQIEYDFRVLDITVIGMTLLFTDRTI
jgi:hypothetical protein